MNLAFETPQFRSAFRELLAWRRDVRSFRCDPLDEALVYDLLSAAVLAPSVGLSQSWRFVRVRGGAARAAVQRSFERCNEEALAGYRGDDAALYARLKLEGLDQAPEQIAVFSDQATAQGRGLGRATMAETLDYSVVAAIQNLWLLARTHGVGLGWVSILDPADVTSVLETPPEWKLIAYLCLGFPCEVGQTPELQRSGWEDRTDVTERILVR